MSLTEGSLRLFKFVPDEFVTQLPPRYDAKCFGLHYSTSNNL